MLTQSQRRRRLQNEIKMETLDMMGNVNDLMNLYQQMRGNPIQFLGQRFNIPAGMNDPNAILQHLLNSGQVTQSQINRIQSMRNNPMISRLMGK